MKKRLLIAALSVVMAVSSLSGCGKKDAEETIVVDMNKDWTKEYDHFFENADLFQNINMKVMFVAGNFARFGLNMDVSISGQNMYMGLSKVSGNNVGYKLGMYTNEKGEVILGAGQGDFAYYKFSMTPDQIEQYQSTFTEYTKSVGEFDQFEEGIGYLREETDLDGTIYDILGGHKEQDGVAVDYEYYVNRRTQTLEKCKMNSNSGDMINIAITKIDKIDFPTNLTDGNDSQFYSSYVSAVQKLLQ